MKKGFDLPLTPIEEAALGDVTFRVVEKDDEMASVMLGVRREKSKDGNESAKIGQGKGAEAGNELEFLLGGEKEA